MARPAAIWHDILPEHLAELEAKVPEPDVQIALKNTLASLPAAIHEREMMEFIRFGLREGMQISGQLAPIVRLGWILGPDRGFADATPEDVGRMLAYQAWPMVFPRRGQPLTARTTWQPVARNYRHYAPRILRRFFYVLLRNTSRLTEEQVNERARALASGLPQPPISPPLGTRIMVRTKSNKVGLTPEQIVAMRNAAESPDFRGDDIDRAQAKLIMSMEGGNRPIHSRRCLIGGIDWEKEELVSANPKGDKRPTPFSMKGRMNSVQGVLSLHPKPEPSSMLLFDSAAARLNIYRPMGHGEFRRLFTEVGRVAGIPAVTAYQTRYGTATDLAANLKPLSAIAVALRHRNRAMSIKYVRLSEQQAIAAGHRLALLLGVLAARVEQKQVADHNDEPLQRLSRIVSAARLQEVLK